jgi:protein-tyrosine phosphatase
MKRDLTHLFEADSAGTADYHIGEPPDQRTLRNASANGIALNHLGRQFRHDDFGRFDHILVMDAENLRNVLRLARTEDEKTKVVLMRNFDPDDHGADVPDPWFGGEAGFQVVFEILDRCTEILINEVLKKP